MYFRRKQSQGRFYLQIVESHRTGDQVRQRVIATLGRLDELESSGQLDRLLRSGARFVRQAMVLDAARSGDAPAIAVRHIGPALLFERLWQETGCQDVIAGLARKRGHHFAVERAVFLTVLHRLMRGGYGVSGARLSRMLGGCLSKDRAAPTSADAVRKFNCNVTLLANQVRISKTSTIHFGGDFPVTSSLLECRRFSSGRRNGDGRKWDVAITVGPLWVWRAIGPKW